MSGATVFVHPDEPPGFSVEDATMNVAVLEFMFETTRMAATMVLSGAEQRFPASTSSLPTVAAQFRIWPHVFR